MTTITTLGLSVPLVVFKFLMKSHLVPDFIPRLPLNRDVPTFKGKEVMASTPDVWLADLRIGLYNADSDYLFVGARANTRGDGRSDVRFTFCHKQHLNDTPSHPAFVSGRMEFITFFFDITWRNIWSVQAYLNPYFINDTTNKDSVFLFNCSGRQEIVKSDGSDVLVHGVPLLSKVNQLNLVGKEVLLLHNK
ncbi:MAG: hypothetical protein AAB461_01155 [Patescibacteria group bacterium]